MTDSTITASDKYACALRELEMRRRVYPRWIEQGRISKEKAEREIEVMQAIAADYDKAAAKERLL